MIAIIGLVLVLLGVLGLVHLLAIGVTAAIVLLVIGAALVAFEYGPRFRR